MCAQWRSVSLATDNLRCPPRHRRRCPGPHNQPARPHPRSGDGAGPAVAGATPGDPNTVKPGSVSTSSLSAALASGRFLVTTEEPPPKGTDLTSFLRRTQRLAGLV